GIGTAFVETLGDLYRDRSFRFSITSSHPSIINHCKRSTCWRAVSLSKFGRGKLEGSRRTGSLGRAVVSFEYLGRNRQ
ncbi:MAG: hypothetical protein IKK39_13870, partial [Thermoguttaceae bacterium]|nr:hypothetical protein [Thermoguttaceae bacterium]